MAYYADGQTAHYNSNAGNTKVEVKPLAGLIGFIEVSHINAVDLFIQLFDSPADSVTVGSTTPTYSLFIPAGDGTFRGGIDNTWSKLPLIFQNGITYAITTTPTGNTAPPTANCNVNIGFL